MADTNPQPDPRALQSLQRLLHGPMSPEARAQMEAKVKELQDQLIARHQSGDGNT